MISWGMLTPQKEHHSQMFHEIILDQTHQDFFSNTRPSASEAPPSLLCPLPTTRMPLPSVTLVPPHVGIRQHESLNPIAALQGLGPCGQATLDLLHGGEYNPGIHVLLEGLVTQIRAKNPLHRKAAGVRTS